MMPKKPKSQRPKVKPAPSPFDSLPVEIVVGIFMHCLPEPRMIDPMNRALAPRLLMRVCRGWRQIASSAPLLWYRFRVKLNEPVWNGLELTAILERSAGLPLHITLYNPIQTASIKRVGHLTALSRYCERISHLALDMSVSAFDAFDAYWGKHHEDAKFSSVEELSLPEIYQPVSLTNTIHIFTDASRLKRASLFAFTPQLVAFPCANLVRFDGRAYTIQELASLFFATPNLTECTIHLDLNPINPGLLALPITHTALQHLRVSGNWYNGTAMSDVLLSWNFPALQSLEIQHGVLGEESDRVIASFAQRSLMLQQLSLNIPPRGMTEFVRSFYTPFPSLHTLTVRHISYGFLEMFFEAFAVDSTFLPGVSVLHFPYMDCVIMLTSLMKEAGPGILKRRALQPSDCALEGLVVTSEKLPAGMNFKGLGEGMPKEGLDVLRELRKNGLNVSITWNTVKESSEFVF
ncbi:hypothetical protein MIND_00772400 [Mycena indigotica]|uniref:F-box domain-containing protein n=1 Tax=Mycena indigotica TaxID=2126181 RepID=A0A8H6SMI1_9AGAR|nr:uncharacterized protein MIND_00772400 [Mycena indigotica]KAF7302059.1 hypothetical protein MIND_00772400 [Mycena indigotica]